MRFLVCLALMATVAMVAAMPADIEVKEIPAASLYDVDVQGHENTGDREARQFYGGYPGGYGGYGGYGGHRGGYGGYGGYPGGYGGYGGYGGHRHHHHHGGYGGYRGGYYG